MKDKYVLVTAARNEQAYIERTIQAVIAQTIRPRRWVIVSDGSTDRTDAIVERYAAEHDFIELLRLEPRRTRDFACQVHGQHAGAERLGDVEHDFIGMLDADISFEPDYYERVLQEFERRPTLGLAGGVLYDLYEGQWIPQRVNPSLNVSGPVQMFRRQCFKDIGGYIPLKYGGQDAVAEVMVRMHGWDVACFDDITVRHHRPTGTEGKSIYRARFFQGHMEYQIGYHPLFLAAKCLARVLEKPCLAGSVLRLWGYCRAWLRREPHVVSPEFIRYLRHEQSQRLWPGARRRACHVAGGPPLRSDPTAQPGSSS